MSDFKEKFRAAAAQRAGAVPSKEQLRLLKAKKQNAGKDSPLVQAQVSSSTLMNGGHITTQVSSSFTATPSTSKALPSDFFQVSNKTVPTPSASQSISMQTANSAMSTPTTSIQRPHNAPAATTSLPQGFFADKAADAKARGEKLPDNKDKEEDFKQFQRMIEDDIKDIASKEAEEAEEDAEYKEDREAYEQSLRLKQLERLKKRESSEAMTETEGPLGLTLPPRKRRVLDVLTEQLQASEEEDGKDADEEEDLVLDWRAKGV
ncbi:hypothetical protein CEUSTIGMA_g10985.t1 [Chlamydomonas eustigma]|uniref:ZNF380 coiled-coil domain-containing protein n=1 Tax=Chlamydomonas eustigma TaxID=1157962 RepID=A0A250XLA4_9CHLO|nr:hypothetical protein CEUSTIGMA_g10985.t1 [Chlamydomonas eustigma]|eukprot:GAX83560.1 hypothetical protein CEUSTIGMA_g10985.t1 [Chlamydomonas eustigma]